MALLHQYDSWVQYFFWFHCHMAQGIDVDHLFVGQGCQGGQDDDTSSSRTPFQISRPEVKYQWNYHFSASRAVLPVVRLTFNSSWVILPKQLLELVKTGLQKKQYDRLTHFKSVWHASWCVKFANFQRPTSLVIMADVNNRSIDLAKTSINTAIWSPVSEKSSF